MKDLDLRSPVLLAVAVGDTTPVPIVGERPIIFSTTEGKPLQWNGTAWVAILPSTSVPASETLSAGALVQLWSNAGTLSARNANATGATPRSADGYILTSVTTSQTAIVYTQGENNRASGLTVGPLWLSTTGGGATSTAPGTGNIIQRIGLALSATRFIFIRDIPIS